MKVFNEEVSCCNDCPMIDRSSDRWSDPKCNLSYGTNVSDKNKTISKDCPFDKPITKEIIEGFGFVNTKQYSDELVFQKNISDYEFYELSLQEDNRVIIEYWSQEKLVTKVLPKETWGCFNIFAGEINNPEELGFILHSIGVIK